MDGVTLTLLKIVSRFVNLMKIRCKKVLLVDVQNAMMMMGMAEPCEGIIRFTYAPHSNSFSNSNSEQAADYEYPIWNSPQMNIDIEIRTIIQIF